MWLAETVGSKSKWNLWINKIASGVDQHEKPWTLSHTRSRTCRILEVTPPTHPPTPLPPLQMDRYQSRSADYKIATRPFHFCLDEAAAPNDFPHSAFVLDRTTSIWRNEAYSCFFFSFFLVFLAHPDQIVCIIIIHFKQRNHWNSWENHHNRPLFSQWSQN